MTRQLGEEGIRTRRNQLAPENSLYRPHVDYTHHPHSTLLDKWLEEHILLKDMWRDWMRNRSTAFWLLLLGGFHDPPGKCNVTSLPWQLGTNTVRDRSRWSQKFDANFLLREKMPSNNFFVVHRHDVVCLVRFAISFGVSLAWGDISRAQVCFGTSIHDTWSIGHSNHKAWLRMDDTELTFRFWRIRKTVMQVLNSSQKALRSFPQRVVSPTSS